MILGWVTRNRADELKRSIASLVPVWNESENPLKKLIVCQNDFNQSSPSKTFRPQGIPIQWIDRMSLEQWVDEMAPQLRLGGEARALLRFTFGLDDETLVSTGGNRNTLSLASTGHSLLSCDDDVVFDLKRASRGLASKFLKHSGFDPSGAFFFQYAKELDSWTNESETVPLLEFLKNHQEWIEKSGITISSIRGDSGCSTPRSIFGLSEAALVQLHDEPGRLKTALSSRLIWRQSESIQSRSLSAFMMFCAGINLKRDFPPFFPYGRGQDASFAFAARALVESLMFSHLDVTLLHSPKREICYGDALSTLDFRINDFCVILWNEFAEKKPPIFGSECVYTRAANFFESYTDGDPESLRRKLREKAEIILKNRIQNLTTRTQTVLFQSRPGLKGLFDREIQVTEEALASIHLGVPSDVSLGKALEWLRFYSQLLRVWKRLKPIFADLTRDSE